MLKVHKNSDRGTANHGWLQSQHSFSFGRYYNPEQMGFGPLIVINEDRVAANQGFGEHGHSDMEIISYVLSGELAHKDSMGNGSVIRYGDVQRMSAGSGIQHSEFNHSNEQPVHFLQIWLKPNVNGISPSYEEAHFSTEDKAGKLRLIASEDGSEGSVTIHQDARIFASILQNEEQLTHTLKQGRTAYLHVINGSLSVNQHTLVTGDALKIKEEESINISGIERAEFLLFDLPY